MSNLLKNDSLGFRNIINDYWEKVIMVLERDMPSPMFTSWVKPIKPYAIDENDNFILIAPEDVTRATIEHRYIDIIKQTIRAVTEKEYNVKVILSEEIDFESGEINEQKKDKLATKYRETIESRYTFDNFVKGKSNEMAFAASQAVAEAPGKTRYNPLFLYGGVGLGKTHLMHSIGNYILHLDPEAKVIYTSSENLTNEFINSLVTRKNQEFRDKYRKIDVLLVDDIQFLSDKEGIQEEFFHTFNTLYSDNKQIVISSDKPPIELKTLEERLRSRFGSGLIVDITQPDFETRTAILEKKSALENLDISKEVIRYIAKNVSSNIRELEGALIKVTAYAKLTNREVTLDLAEKALHDVVNETEQKREITVELIQEIVAEHYGITTDEMKSKKRTQHVVFSRHVAMYLTRMIMDIALYAVGKKFGGRDHTTVIHACNKINEVLESDPELRETLVILEKKIKGE